MLQSWREGGIRECSKCKSRVRKWVPWGKLWGLLEWTYVTGFHLKDYEYARVKMFNNITLSHQKAIPWEFCCGGGADCFALFYWFYLFSSICGTKEYITLEPVHVLNRVKCGSERRARWGPILNFLNYLSNCPSIW